MIVYNVTTKVNHSIAKDWLDWLKNEYNPAMLQTGCFTHAVIFHLTDHDDVEGMTYAVQYHAKDEETYKRFLRTYDHAMQKMSLDKWQNKYISFRTMMKAVN
jgi:hypothetical protein